MTPRSLLNVVFRHRVKFIVTLLVCLFLAAAYCLIATPKYRSTAELLVRFGTNQQQSAINGVAPAIPAQQQERKEIVNSQIALMHSRDLLRDVLKTVGIARVYPGLSAKSQADLENLAINRLNHDLKTEGGQDSDIIDVALLNPDAQVAAKTLRTLIAKFKKRAASVYQSEQLGFLQNQLKQSRGQLTKSRNAVEAFRTSTGIASLDEERSLLLRQRSQTRQKLVQTVSTQHEAEQRYRRLETALKKLPYHITLSNEADRFKPVDDTRERLNELRQRAYSMSLNYRPDSVPMVDLDKQIRFAEHQLTTLERQGVARLRTGPNPVYEAMQKDALTAAGNEAAAEGARHPLEAELNRIDARLADLSRKAGELNQLQLQEQVDEENFRNYLQGVETARLDTDLNRQGITSVATVQEPTVPVNTAQPRVLLILGITFLIGIALGIAITFFAELADEAFSTPGQIESVLGVPVLAVFPQMPLGAAPGQRL
ncbi:MAG: GumC family protein [Stellaceae bacterium]